MMRRVVIGCLVMVCWVLVPGAFALGEHARFERVQVLAGEAGTLNAAAPSSVRVIAASAMNDDDKQSCSATLSSPPDGASIDFPRAFSWSTSGTCNDPFLAFATSPTPTDLEGFHVSGTSRIVSAADWITIRTALGPATTYYWTIGEVDNGGFFQSAAPYRSFTEIAACSVTLMGPPADVAVRFPQVFTWAPAGDCDNLRLGFAASDSPGQVYSLAVSGTSRSISAADWTLAESVLGTGSNYYWTIGTMENESFSALTPFRAFVVDASACRAALSSPAAGAAISFPRTFTWTINGNCVNLRLVFATSPSPSQVASSTVTETNLTVSAADWESAKTLIGTSSTYYWSIAELVDSRISFLAPLRPFTEIPSTGTGALVDSLLGRSGGTGGGELFDVNGDGFLDVADLVTVLGTGARDS